MKGFPVTAWVLLLMAVLPGVALAAWSAARGRKAFRRRDDAR